MRSRGHDITIASLLGASSVKRVTHLSTSFGICFMEWVKKTSCLSDRKVKRKNQVPKYHAPSPEGYDEEDTRSIDKKTS